MNGRTREFHLGDILSVTTSHMVSPRHVDGLCDLLGWMTGENLAFEENWHQLSRLSDECAGSLLAQHPDLAQVTVPDGLDSKEAAMSWLATVTARLGETRLVCALDPDDHTRIAPATEMRMEVQKRMSVLAAGSGMHPSKPRRPKNPPDNPGRGRPGATP